MHVMGLWIQNVRLGLGVERESDQERGIGDKVFRERENYVNMGL